jgi:hypothetical protein
MLRIFVFSMGQWLNRNNLDCLLGIPLPWYGQPQLEVFGPVNLVGIRTQLKGAVNIVYPYSGAPLSLFSDRISNLS